MDSESGWLGPNLLYNCLDGFSNGLKYQVTAFGTSLHKTPDLPQTFKERLEISMREVMQTIDGFRSEMLSAVGSENLGAKSPVDTQITSTVPSQVTNGKVVRPLSVVPTITSLDDLQHEVAPIWNSSPHSSSTPRLNDKKNHMVMNSSGRSDVGPHISFADDETIRSVRYHTDDDPLQITSFATASYDVGQQHFAEKMSASIKEEGRLPSFISADVGTQLSRQTNEERLEERRSETTRPSREASIEEMAANALRNRPVQTTATTEQNYLQAASVDLDKEDEEDDPTGFIIRGVFNPNYPARLAWDLNTMFLVMCDAVILPYQMSYKDGDNPDMFDTTWLALTTTFFAIDIIANFITGYQAGSRDTDCEPGKMITARRRIAKNYFRTWFAIDFVSTVPWGVVASLVLGGGSGSAGQLGKLTKVIKFVRFMRLMRMLRLAKLAAIWEKVEARCGSVVLIQGVGLLRVLFVLVCICHWNACIWWMIGQEKSIITDMMSDEDQAHWVSTPHWTTILRSNGPNEPMWRWKDRAVGEAYIFCFYWTLGVMRTMPAEVTPVSQPERVYVMVFMFFAFSAFAICVAMITQTFFKFSERKRVFNDDMAAVRMHLRKYKASEQLQMKIKTYLRHMFDTRSIANREGPMLGQIPDHLKSELQHIRCLPHVERLTRVFSNVSSKALQLLTTDEHICATRNMAPGDVLSLKDNCAKAAWILVVGRLRIQQENDESESSTHTMRTKITIVDEKTLASEEPYFSLHTVICQCACTCLRIDKDRFYNKVEGNAMFWNSWSNRPSSSSSRSAMTRTGSNMGREATIRGEPSYANIVAETQSQGSNVQNDQIIVQHAVDTAVMTAC